jgi:hypothetical protein
LAFVAQNGVQAQYNYTTNADGYSITLTGYTGLGGNVNIPTNIGGFTVTGIASEAFEGNTNITSITIGNSVTTIGEYAFAQCLSLTSATIPASVTNLGEEIFSVCLSLTNAIISHGVTSISLGMFDSCYGLPYVLIPASVTNIGSGAFIDCLDLKGILFEGNAPATLPTSFTADGHLTIYYLLGSTKWDNYPSESGFTPVLWNPLIQIGGCNFGVRSNQFGFNITSPNNIPIVINACTNLVNPVWTPLTNVMLTNGSYSFSDKQWTNYQHRYYGIGFP